MCHLSAMTPKEITVIQHALRIALEDGSLFAGTDLEDAEVNRMVESIRTKLTSMRAGALARRG